MGLAIRPEEIVLSVSRPEEEANVLAGRVRSVRDRGPLLRVDLEAEIPLVALVPRALASELSLSVGDPVWARLPSACIHLFPRERSS